MWNVRSHLLRQRVRLFEKGFFKGKDAGLSCSTGYWSWVDLRGVTRTLAIRGVFGIGIFMKGVAFVG